MFLYGCGYQGCGNSELIAGYFYLFPTRSTYSPYTFHTAQLQFTKHLLQILDNALQDWLFPHPWWLCNGAHHGCDYSDSNKLIAELVLNTCEFLIGIKASNWNHSRLSATTYYT